MKKKYYILVLTFLCILCGQASYAFTDGEGWGDFNHDGIPDIIELDGVTVGGSGQQCYSCDCDSFFCPGGDPNNLSDPDPEPVPDDQGSGGGGVPENPEVPDPHITNEITNPCLKSAVNRIINNSVPNKFTNILNGAFFRQDDQSLIFTTYFDNSAEGIKTDGERIGNMYNQTIQLNLAALQFASEEYIAAVIYHEILHADMTSAGISKSDQHYAMSMKWVDQISNQLIIDFPNLSKADADAIAWGGLSETSLWQTMQTNDTNNNTSITGDIAEINKNFKNVNNSTNGNYGTPCTN